MKVKSLLPLESQKLSKNYNPTKSFRNNPCNFTIGEWILKLGFDVEDYVVVSEKKG